MPTHRLKHTFSAGELSPLMDARLDFSRYANGCKKLRNMVCTTQGPATRRGGTRYIGDLTALGLDTTDPRVRMIPFIFNELQAYSMIFFVHTDGNVKLVFGDGTGLLAYSDPVPSECPPGSATSGLTPGDIVMLDLGPVVADPHNEGASGWDIEHFDWAQSGDEIYIAQAGMNPHIIKRWGPMCWELSSVTFTDQPAEWSDANGWPERVTFHQQRLVFAASVLYRQTVWMSKAGDFSDFGVSVTLVDSDAITFTLDSGTQNKIVWMNSSKALQLGTIANEWTVQGSTRTALTPTNVLAQRQTNRGGERNKALMIGITTLFVERHGRVINEFVYDYTYDSYKVSDMSVLSPHVTENYSIHDWTYQQTPDSIIWAIREDGELIGITYQRDHKVIGWHVHSTEGEFKAITSVPGDTREDEVWVVVKRTLNGATKYYVEKMAEVFKSESAADARFLDSFLEYTGAAARVMTGLAHLEGETIQILADGAIQVPQTVTGGEIELSNDYTNVVMGLGYVSEVWPNLADIADITGTAYGRMSRITKLDLDFYCTLGGYVGRYDIEDGETEEELPFREEWDLTNAAVPLYTGIYHWDYSEGFDRNSQYFIRQKQPLPLTIRGVTETIEVFE